MCCAAARAFTTLYQYFRCYNTIVPHMALLQLPVDWRGTHTSAMTPLLDIKQEILVDSILCFHDGKTLAAKTKAWIPRVYRMCPFMVLCGVQRRAAAAKR